MNTRYFPKAILADAYFLLEKVIFVSEGRKEFGKNFHRREVRKEKLLLAYIKKYLTKFKGSIM